MSFPISRPFYAKNLLSSVHNTRRPTTIYVDIDHLRRSNTAQTHDIRNLTQLAISDRGVRNSDDEGQAPIPSLRLQLH